ncbi:MAG: energy transducer TonB [Steroidobacteraceae bacterium]
MLLTQDRLQQRSDVTALLCTAVLLLVALSDAPTHWDAPAMRARDERSLELTLQAEPEPQPAPAPVPSPPVHPRTRPAAPRAVAASVAPAPVPQAATDPPLAVPEGAAVMPAASESPPTAAVPPAHADSDARYAALLRADIDVRTRPPDSIQYRLRHPSGEVRVRFLLSRNGEIRATALSSTSGSPILDQAALDVVASGRYPPMPADAFAGEAQHTFTVTIEFQPRTSRR